MDIKVLEKQVRKLDKEIFTILESSGYDLENVDYDKKKDYALYSVMHDIISHLAYINYKLNGENIKDFP